MWKPTRLLHGEGRRPWRPEGTTPHDGTRSRGPTGVWAVACLHTEIGLPVVTGQHRSLRAEDNEIPRQNRPVRLSDGESDKGRRPEPVRLSGQKPPSRTLSQTPRFPGISSRSAEWPNTNVSGQSSLVVHPVSPLTPGTDAIPGRRRGR